MTQNEIQAQLGPGMEISDMVHDLWNGPAGRRFDSSEDLMANLLSDTPDVDVLVAARQWLGLPVLQ